MSRLAHYGWILAALILAAGCAGPRRPVQPLPTATAEELLQRLEINAHTFENLRGLAKVRVRTGEDRLSGSQVLLAEKPDRFRVEVLGLFGQPWLVMVSDGSNLQALLPGENRFLEGPASPENLQRFTRLPLKVTDLVHLLLYQVPLIGGSKTQAVPLADGGSRLLLAGENGARQEVDFDPDRRMIASRYMDSGEVWLEIRYGEFSEAVPDFPRQLQLQLPRRGIEAEVEFSELQLNTSLPQERFRLNPPPGIRPEPLPR